MHLIMGLGNPGEKYKNSRHNVGFILLEEIFPTGFGGDKYAQAEVLIDNDNIFVKPLTFMNNSGVSAKVLSDKHGIVSEHVIVIHDDIDLPFGAMKIVFNSGSAGHNGIKSIIDNLGTNKFIRIKIGIAPTDENGKAIKPKPGIFGSQQSAVSKYVLKDFSKGDLEKIKKLAPAVKQVVETLARDGKEKAMNKFN